MQCVVEVLYVRERSHISKSLNFHAWSAEDSSRTRSYSNGTRVYWFRVVPVLGYSRASGARSAGQGLRRLWERELSTLLGYGHLPTENQNVSIQFQCGYSKSSTYQ